jgi:hypothetical protein
MAKAMWAFGITWHTDFWEMNQSETRIACGGHVC